MEGVGNWAIIPFNKLTKGVWASALSPNEREVMQEGFGWGKIERVGVVSWFQFRQHEEERGDLRRLSKDVVWARRNDGDGAAVVC